MKKKRQNRSDPKQNKALAVRLALEANPDGTTDQLIAAARKYGHDVKEIDVYLARSRVKAKAKSNPAESVEAARRLLELAGSPEAAIATINAVAALMR